MTDSKFKSILNSLSDNNDILRELSSAEQAQLKNDLLKMFQDVYSICQKYQLTIMLGGGSALGSARHQGFIPWDDDLDLMMPRMDYEKFKDVFETELGDRYILSAPNYRGKSKARFPKIIKKGTCMKELTDINSDLPNGIFLDIFLIENIPERKLHQKAKGIWCSGLMYASTRAFWYEHNCPALASYMCRTEAGATDYRRKMKIGRLCAIIPSWMWFNWVDRAIQYNGKTSLVGMPTGRKHYFGEILPREVMLPVAYSSFENLNVPVPHDSDRYLKNLYGNYMELPPVEKRERHFIVELNLGNS